MKKTVTVNIGGAFFHIDEDAFEILKKYLETIRGYFINTVGCDEIMADIESRIAEMFKATQSPIKEVITLDDVNNVIAVMGQPEDYLDIENNETENNSSQTENRNYTSNTSHTKRIFRDPDNRVLGGVCSGVGNYFGIDPVWIRIAFVIMFFAFGTGPFLYLILWIIIPKAKTTAEKLEMRGEPVTAENIGKTIREEMEGVKNSFNSISNDFRFKKRNLNSIVNNLINLLKQLITLTLNIAAKVLGFSLIATALFLFMLFFSIVITDVFILNFNNINVSNASIYDFLQLFISNNFDISLAFIAISLLFLVPVVTLIFIGSKLLFKLNKNFNAFSVILAVAWISGILLAIYCTYTIAYDFRKTGNVIQSIGIPSGDTLYISANSINKQGNIIISIKDDDKNNLINITNDSLFFYYPQLSVVKSSNDSVYLSIEQIARGKTKKIAADRAAGIHYEFTYTENQLVLNNFFTASTNDKFRAQHLKLTLNLPEGKTVYLDKSLENILFDIKNTTNTLNKEIINHYWTMTRNGLTKVDEN